MTSRVCLIKSVINSLPILYLSFFRAPNIVHKLVSRLQEKFLWGWGYEGRKIAWVVWNEVCFPVEVGGLGFNNVGRFNVALLAKWKW